MSPSDGNNSDQQKTKTALEIEARRQRSEQITGFMARVMPWPSSDEPGYVNLHWLNGAAMPGRPFRLLDDFMQRVVYMAQRTRWDIYYCLSSQAKTGKIYRKEVTAARHKRDALKLKAIWLDMDVKPGAYNSVGDSIAAITKFCEETAVPAPTAIVLSGGGVHIYWISDRPLSVDEWAPFASGLRTLAHAHGVLFDEGVTTDCARVLRIPGTYNYKDAQKRAVRLAYLAPTDLNFRPHRR
jgi:hypothetical protein